MSFTMDIEMRPVASLKAAEQNSRSHPQAQIEQIMASMGTFGWTMPILIDEDGKIIAGHARVEAGRQLGIEQAPCVIASGWSEEKKEAYQITDNRLSELSEWNLEVLGDQLKRLSSFEFDMSFLDLTTGFDDSLFKPNLDPNIGAISDVTAAQVKQKQEQIDEQINQAGTAKNTYKIECPHCGQELEVEI